MTNIEKLLSGEPVGRKKTSRLGQVLSRALFPDAFASGKKAAQSSSTSAPSQSSSKPATSTARKMHRRIGGGYTAPTSSGTIRTSKRNATG